MLAEAWPDLAQAPPALLAHGEPGFRTSAVACRHTDKACEPDIDGNDADDSDSDSHSESVEDCIATLIKLSQRHDRPETELAWKAAMPPLAKALIGLSFRLPAERDAVLAEASGLMGSGVDLGEVDLSYGRSVLHWLTLMGDATMVDYLLRRGAVRDIERADLGGHTPLSLLVRLRVAPLGIQRPPDTAAIVGVLLDHGAQLTSLPHRGCELLYLSDLTPALVRRLATMGVPVDGATAMDRETPMLRACLRGHWALAGTFVELGANAAVRGRFGSTALHMVQLPEWLAKQLIERGAPTEARDVMGQTPLMVACETGNLPLARLFLQYGASAKAVSADGTSVLQVAQAIGGEIERLIREALMLQPALMLASQ